MWYYIIAVIFSKQYYTYIDEIADVNVVACKMKM